MNENGRYQATPKQGHDLDLDGGYLRVCPFSSTYNEDDLAKAFLNADEAARDESIGSYRSLVAGHVKSDGYRDDGSSGGMTTWFLDRLISEGHVDAVIHVAQDTNDDFLFKYRVSSSSNEVRNGSKTRYYPVEMSEILRFVRNNEARYAIVGVPCFIKAIRLLQLEDEVIGERICFTVGLVCGHLKSTRFADALAWQQGVRPGELESIDFRTKTKHTASAYEVSVSSRDGQVASALNSDHLVSDWGLGMFKYRACEFCDDVLNETADISFGDAWIPQFNGDPEGSNIAVIRSESALTIINRNSDALEQTDVDAGLVANSQRAGLRHRREGLAYRLHILSLEGHAVPIKRVRPSEDIPQHRKRIYDIRLRFISEADRAWNKALRSGTFETFERELRPLVANYRRAYEHGLGQRLKGTLVRAAPWVRPLARRVKRQLNELRKTASPPPRK